MILFLLCASLFITLYLLLKGVFYISILLGIPFAILFVLTILEILFCFIVRKKVNEKRILILFIISIVGLGSPFGSLLLDLSSIQYIDQAPKEVKAKVFYKNYSMTKELYFLFDEQIKYIVDNYLEKGVQLEIEYYDSYTKIMLLPEMNASTAVFQRHTIFMNQKLADLIIQNLSRRRYYDYGKLYEAKIKLYASESNIQILKDNYQKMIDRIVEHKHQLQSIIEE